MLVAHQAHAPAERALPGRVSKWFGASVQPGRAPLPTQVVTAAAGSFRLHGSYIDGAAKSMSRRLATWAAAPFSVPHSLIRDLLLDA